MTRILIHRSNSTWFQKKLMFFENHWRNEIFSNFMLGSKKLSLHQRYVWAGSIFFSIQSYFLTYDWLESFLPSGLRNIDKLQDNYSDCLKRILLESNLPPTNTSSWPRNTFKNSNFKYQEKLKGTFWRWQAASLVLCKTKLLEGKFSAKFATSPYFWFW